MQITHSKLSGKITLSDAFSTNCKDANANQYDSALQEAAVKIEELISEYQCSFDNTNNTGVEGQEGEENLNGQSVQSDKLMVMIKTAMNRAKGTQDGRITFEKGKNAEAEKSRGAVEKNENGAQVFKMPHSLNTEETAATRKHSRYLS